MRSDRVASPRHRRQSISVKPGQAEPSFPARDFFRSAVDALGRSVNLSVVVPPYSRRAASRMVAIGAFGFQTEQDVWRFCVSFGLDHLAAALDDGEVTTDVALLKAWDDQTKVQMEFAMYERVIRNHSAAIRTLIRGGHAAKAVEIAEAVWRQHDKIEDQYWRKVYRAQAKELLDMARRALVEDGKQERAGRAAERAASGNGDLRHGQE